MCFSPSTLFHVSVHVLISYLVSIKIGGLEAVCSMALWTLSGFVPVQMRGKMESNFLGGVFFAIVEDL